MHWNIVIPCYQQALWLEACLRSVDTALRYATGTATVTVVDDASPDHTPELMQYLRVLYPWLRYIRHGTNRGVSAARNTGIAAVQSEYVLVLDADDRISRKFLQVCEDVLARADIAFTDRRRFGQQWQYFPASRVTLGRLQQGPFIHCSCPYRRTVWETVGGYDEGEDLRLNFEDYDFWIRAAKAGCVFECAPRRAILWHRHHGRHRLQAEALRRQLQSRVLFQDAVAAVQRRHPGFYTQRG